MHQWPFCGQFIDVYKPNEVCVFSAVCGSLQKTGLHSSIGVCMSCSIYCAWYSSLTHNEGQGFTHIGVYLCILNFGPK